MQRNDRTHELVDLCKEVAKLADSNSRQYYIGSGFSIDFSLGELTRDHEDVDLVVAASDVKWWKHEFTKRGYSIGAYDYMNYFHGAFTVRHASADPNDPSDFMAEVWPMEFRDDGTLVPPHTADHPGREWWRGKNWHKLKRVMYEDVPMIIEDPQIVIDQKLDHVRYHKEKLAEKHLHDLRLLGRQDEYDALIKELEL